MRPNWKPTPLSWDGGAGIDTYVGSNSEELIRSKGGNDSLSGSGGSDTYVFEQTFAANGMDTITDFTVKQFGTNRADVLDLSNALGKDVTRSTISDYVWVAGNKLFVDPDGTGGDNAQIWAVLDGVKAGDKLNIRTGGFSGLITAKPEVKYLTVGRDGAWYEDAATANGTLDNGEALIAAGDFKDSNSDGYYTIKGLKIVRDNVFVRFVDGTTPRSLDLTGFGSGDKIILDGSVNPSTYLGLDPGHAWRGHTGIYTYLVTNNTHLGAIAADITVCRNTLNTHGGRGTHYRASARLSAVNTQISCVGGLEIGRVRHYTTTTYLADNPIFHCLAKGLPITKYSIDIITPG